jgi:hypothetical protein
VQAEVYDSLLKKAKYVEAQRFACVVAHARTGAADAADCGSIAGVVEVSIQGDRDVNHLLGVAEYRT